MHLEFLIEDQSGKLMLEKLLPNLLSPRHSFQVHSYKGIGRIPKDLTSKSDPAKRILLDQLPRLLGGYGKAFAAYPKGYEAAVVVVCDLDDRNLCKFSIELKKVLGKAKPAPKTEFCIAIEEGEAWILGDPGAIKKAYPKAKMAILAAYKNDSICGTWELLADVIYPGGADALKAQGYQEIGREKCRWAEAIAQLLDVDKNASPSFNRFVAAVRQFESS